MEHGTDKQDSRSNGDRRRTVSGALPQLSTDDQSPITSTSSEPMRFPWSSPLSPSSPSNSSSVTTTGARASPTKSNSHKRSLSGNILTRFSFLRTAIDDEDVPSREERGTEFQSPKVRKSIDDEDDDDDDDDTNSSPAKGESSLAAALKPTKTRKRKGSLRKTALLGGRKQVTEGRERRNSLLQRSPSSKQTLQKSPDDQSPTIQPPENLPVRPPSPSKVTPEKESPPDLQRQLSFESTSGLSSSDNGWSEPAAVKAARLSLLTDHKPQHNPYGGVNELGSPLEVKSPNRQDSYASMTDDDDMLTFDRPANSFAAQSRESISLKPPLTSTSTSYFPSVSSVSEPPSDSRRRSSKMSRSSPLSRNMTTLSSFSEPEPHDYTETEYWGWVILFVTWLTFTVGMGSCLEIWTWAWDVGETPYAPPELEDDPTLPIVGYYPALIVLTGVVAWVWITVAWVGMKYFRHAKIEV